MSSTGVEVYSSEQPWLHQREGIFSVRSASSAAEYDLRRRVFYPLRLTLRFHTAWTLSGLWEGLLSGCLAKRESMARLGGFLPVCFRAIELLERTLPCLCLQLQAS